MAFQFELGYEVKLVGTNLIGTIIGRSEYIEEPTLYWVLYINAQGNPVKDWFKTSELE